jgi:hypothetical protein
LQQIVARIESSESEITNITKVLKWPYLYSFQAVRLHYWIIFARNSDSAAQPARFIAGTSEARAGML